MSAQAAFTLARQRHSEGDLSTAVDIYQQIIQQDPGHVHAICMLGVATHQMGDSKQALDLIAHAIALKPDFAGAYNNRGEILKSLDRLEEAKASYEKAISLEPGMSEAHNNLGTLFRQVGRLDVAEACYRTAITLKPDYAEPHTNLGNVYDEIGQFDKAIACHRQAIAINPRYMMAHRNLGKVLHEVGKLDEAVQSYRHALALEPGDAETFRQVARIKRFTHHDDDIVSMERSYARDDLPVDQKMHLAFALGKAFEDIREYDASFGYIREANRIKNDTFSYDIREDARMFDRLKAAYTRDIFLKHEGAGRPDDTPIFILGMPRSGTTLVEQILASHPNVHGAGELPFLLELVTAMTIDETNRYPENIWRMESASFRNIADYYLRKLRERAPGISRITDKMPGNFLHIGLIKLMLPNARVIHCKRSPMDTCLSIYKNNFATDGHYYGYDMENLGHYYNLYSGIMDHWRSVLPGFFHEVCYEDLVADREPHIRSLLDFCGLKWNPACLDFHKTDRPVNTASAAQVRQPIYKSSVRSWQNYERQLAPLLNILDPSHGALQEKRS